jgi:ATPase subunit of ABC transporter with duplicated ATPase domains
MAGGHIGTRGLLQTTRQVGPSGGGKSAIMECLAGALTELGTKHVIWRMNPKAVTAPQMFGRMDPTTGDWTDGVFAVLWRRWVRFSRGSLVAPAALLLID